MINVQDNQIQNLTKNRQKKLFGNCDSILVIFVTEILFLGSKMAITFLLSNIFGSIIHKSKHVRRHFKYAKKYPRKENFKSKAVDYLELCAHDLQLFQ